MQSAERTPYPLHRSGTFNRSMLLKCRVGTQERAERASVHLLDGVSALVLLDISRNTAPTEWLPAALVLCHRRIPRIRRNFLPVSGPKLGRGSLASAGRCCSCELRIVARTQRQLDLQDRHVASRLPASPAPQQRAHGSTPKCGFQEVA
jgi:hypothetical protein